MLSSVPSSAMAGVGTSQTPAEIKERRIPIDEQKIDYSSLKRNMFPLARMAAGHMRRPGGSKPKVVYPAHVAMMAYEDSYTHEREASVEIWENKGAYEQQRASSASLVLSLLVLPVPTQPSKFLVVSCKSTNGFGPVVDSTADYLEALFQLPKEKFIRRMRDAKARHMGYLLRLDPLEA